jgi:hypothetical protein
VRGYRILFVRLQDDDWVVKAVFHVVLSHASKDPAVPDRYECVTDHYNDVGDAKNGFLFVPSSRAHANLTDDEILSGKWCFGTVLIGCDAFCEWLISHMQVQGMNRSLEPRVSLQNATFRGTPRVAGAALAPCFCALPR